MAEPYRILIVDDDESTLRSLGLIFKKQGYQVETAETGRGALDKARQAFFHVALLDIRLPDVQGLELLAPLREMHPDMGLLVVTGHASVNSVMQALDGGVDGYITKPLDMDHVLARIRDILEKQRLVAEKRQVESQRDEALSALQQRNRELELLNRIGQALNSSLDLDAVLSTALEEARRLLDVVAVSVWLVDAESGELVCRQASGLQSEVVRGRRLRPGQGLAGWVAGHDQSLIVPDATSDERYVKEVGESAGLDLRSILGVPMRAKERVIGVLQAVDSRIACFGPADLRLLESLATAAAVAVDNARLYAQAQAEIAERGQAEETLRGTTQTLQALIQASPLAIYTLKPDGTVGALWNPAAERMFGWREQEAVGRPLPFVPGDKQQEYEALLNQLLQGEAFANTELRRHKKDGSPIHISVSSAPLRDRQGHVVEIVSVAADVTDRVRAEEETRQRNRELALLNRVIAATAAEPEPEAILETACRELAYAFDVPQVAAALLNERKTEAVVVAEYLAEGRPPALERAIPVEDNPSFQYLLTQKAPLAVSDAQSDPRLAPLHGALRERGTVSLLILPLMIQGELVGSLGLDAIQPREFSAGEISLAWSVADQVSGALARARLAQSQRRLSAALEQAGEAVMITDTQGTIQYVNPAFERITGYSQVDAVGQNPRMLKSGEQDAAFYRDLWTTISSGEVWHGRLVNKRKDGTRYTVDTTITPVRDEGGRVVNHISLQRDVTHDLQLEEQYRQAQKMEAVGRLTAGIAHDFNNLLTAINGFAELIHFQLGPADPAHEMAAKIAESGKRAAGLVRQLLAFSRKQVINPQVLDLNTVVTEMDKMLRRIIGEDVQLAANLAPDLWEVKVDPGQIQQVIVNLAVNARDAMPDGGKLTIETANVVMDGNYVADHLGAEPGEYVLLAVSDTGMGMSQEVQAHVFEPFFTTKGLGKGTGLGLATVYGIVKQSQGNIWFYSEQGVGTTFKIYLPRTGEEAQPFIETEAAGEGPSGGETILLVEDDERVRELARLTLEHQGYVVLEASDGQEALRLANEHGGPIHLLLTDVVMPGMSGQTLSQRLALTQGNLKTLFVSGYPDEAVAHHGVLEPGVAFLQKPFGPMALARKVRAVLDSTRPEAPSERAGRGPSASD